jgi:hypothetical protein
MGTISGATHIKMIFSFPACIGKHFISNTLCISDNFVKHLLQAPKKEIKSQIWKMVGGGGGQGMNLSFNIQ